MRDDNYTLLRCCLKLKLRYMRVKLQENDLWLNASLLEDMRNLINITHYMTVEINRSPLVARREAYLREALK
jgi:hypothetical protein